jgi:hypothetical protein
MLRAPAQTSEGERHHRAPSSRNIKRLTAFLRELYERPTPLPLVIPLVIHR